MAPKSEDPDMMTSDESPQATAPEIVASQSKEMSVASPSEAPEDITAKTTEENAGEEDKAEASPDTEGETEKDMDAIEGAIELEEKVEGQSFQKMCSQIEMPSLGCFDLSTIACCGLGSTMLYNEDSAAADGDSNFATNEKTEEEKKAMIENEKATQIQKVARSKLARKTADALKAEQEAANAQASIEPALSTPETAPEQAPIKVEKTVEKKSFIQKIASLFSGCKKSDKQVVTQHEETAHV